MAKKLRGKNLTKKLIEVLEEMKKLGYKTAPISRSTVQRRLGLDSRSTLLLNGRDQLIDNAKNSQLHEAGLDTNKKQRRKTQDEQIQTLKSEITSIKLDRDNLVEKFAKVINGLQAKGLSVEQIMLPLRPNYKKSKK
jgi:hypothetical protein